MSQPIVEAAGIIVYRRAADGMPEFLLLRNANRQEWGFPKGHRDQEDADLLATAVRELQEETGLSDVLVHSGFRMTLDYQVRGRATGAPSQKHVFYLLARAESYTVVLSREHDHFVWASASKTRALLAFDSLRAVVDSALDYLTHPSSTSHLL